MNAPLQTKEEIFKYLSAIVNGTVSGSVPLSKPVLEGISMAATRLADAETGPSALLEALAALGLQHLDSVAAQCHYQATVRHQETIAHLRAVAQSIIHPMPRRHLLFAPVGLFDEPAVLELENRLWQQVMRQRTRKINCLFSGLSPNGTITANDWYIRLQKEAPKNRIKFSQWNY